jgi:hypothetical protein
MHCLSLYNSKAFKRAARNLPLETPPAPPLHKKQATIQALTRKVKRLTWRLKKPSPMASAVDIDSIQGHIKAGDLTSVLSKLRSLLNHCQTNTTFASPAGRLSFTIDILKSLELESQGKSRKGSQYLSDTQHILGNLRLSGQVGYEKIAHNLGLATERTARGWNYKFPRFECGLSDSNFATIAAIYKDLMEQYDIKEDVLCFFAEDETVIIPEPDWDERDDCIIGFCGTKCAKRCEVTSCKCDPGEKHQCMMDAPRFVVGSREDGYENIKKAKDTMVVSTYARVVMINPMHERLPALTCLLVGTCLRFTEKDYVLPQWEQLQILFDKHVRGVVGPLIGHASDGDPRRRKAFRSTMLSKEVEVGQRRYGLARADFTHTGLVVNGIPSGIMDQDYFHNFKKLINCFDNPQKLLTIGDIGHAHINDLRVLTTATNVLHGVRDADLVRNGFDKTDVPSAQRIVSKKVITFLEAEIERGDKTLRATLTYIKLCRLYLNLFLSRKMTLKVRIKSAGYIVTYLRTWRLWVIKKNLDQAKHCPPRETCEDVILSCHMVVLLMMAQRDIKKGTNVLLKRTGSDCVEALFSSLGSWVLNMRNYKLQSARQTIQGLIVESMRKAAGNLRSDQRNKRLRSVWDDDEPNDSDADMSDIPVDTEISKLWGAGVEEAKTCCRRDGMKITGHPENEEILFGKKTDAARAKARAGARRAKVRAEEEEARVKTGSEVEDDVVEVVASEVLTEEKQESNGEVVEEVEGAVVTEEKQEINVMTDIVDVGIEIIKEGLNKVESKVYIEELQINLHKRAVISTLFKGLKLSADRLTRIRNAENTELNWHIGKDEWSISLHGDVAVLFENDNDKKEVWFGRIKRIRRELRRNKFVEYRLPVMIGESRPQHIMLTIQYFHIVKGKVRMLRLGEAIDDSVHLECVICPVHITSSDRFLFEIETASYETAMKGLDNTMYATDEDIDEDNA